MTDMTDMTDVPSPDPDGAFAPISEQVDAFKRAIEAIVLVAHDPVSAELLAHLLEPPTT